MMSPLTSMTGNMIRFLKMSYELPFLLLTEQRNPALISSFVNPTEDRCFASACQSSGAYPIPKCRTSADESPRFAIYS